MKHFKFIPQKLLNTTRAELSGIFYSRVDENGSWTIRIQLPTRAILKKTSKAKLTWTPPWIPLIDPLYASVGMFSTKIDRLSYWAFSIAPGFMRLAGVELNWIDDPTDILHEPKVPDFDIPRPPRTTPVTSLRTEPLEHEVLVITDRGEIRLPRHRWEALILHSQGRRTPSHPEGRRTPAHPEGFTWIDELKIPNHLILSQV